MKVSFQTYDLSLIHCAEGEPISGVSYFVMGSVSVVLTYILVHAGFILSLPTTILLYSLINDFFMSRLQLLFVH